MYLRQSRASLHAAAVLLTVSSVALCASLVAVSSASATGDANVAACPNEVLTGFQESLPDCRAYERVSPSYKGGYDATSYQGLTFPAEASAEGGSLLYMSKGAFANPPAALFPDVYIATRGAGGWQTTNETPPTPQAVPYASAEGGFGYDFSPDLSEVVLKTPNPVQAVAPPSEIPTPNAFNLFLRDADGRYSLVNTAAPANLPGPCDECLASQDNLAFTGANAGAPGAPAFTHVLFENNESLLTSPVVPSEPGVENLYESNMSQLAGARVHPVGVLPDGTLAAGGSVAGSGVAAGYSSTWIPTQNNDQRAEHAISPDGSRIVFQAAADAGLPEPAQNGLTEVYDRIGASSTIELSAHAPGATPANTTAEPARFWAASADGSRVFFTSSAELTTQSNAGPTNEGSDLYSFDTATSTLSDLTVDASDPNGASVLGVVGASEDGSYVYFVAAGRLEEGKGIAGEPNLYVSHNGGAPVFIATLDPEDANDWTPTITRLNAYLTPDGQHLAFMSINSLTGYNNHDRSGSGERDTEVFEYSASSGLLACASCDASGLQPVMGSFIGFNWSNHVGTPFYRPRILSDDGARLFFGTRKPLVPETSPVFGLSDLFEYQGGRISPIDKNSFFLDASASGNDLFFATRDRLVPEDQDGYSDVYDARVGGGAAQLTLPQCTGGECRAPYAGAPSIATPASESFAGAGNLAPPTPGPITTSAGKTAAQVRAARLAKALRVCRKKSRSQRRGCERAARKRYSAKSSAKAKPSTRRVQ